MGRRKKGKKGAQAAGGSSGGRGGRGGSSSDCVPVSALEVEGGEFVVLDGSEMEGGGQILRNAFACATLLGVPLHVVKVRGGRRVPGLRMQHLVGINLVSGMCGGALAGNAVKSQEVKYIPPTSGVGAVGGGTYQGTIESAGSTMLLAQVSLPVAMFAGGDVVVEMTGGTNAMHAPQIEFAVEVLLPTLRRFGAEAVELDVERRGFFPAGNAIVKMRTSPVGVLSPLVALDRGHIVRVEIKAFTAGRVPEEVGGRMNKAVVKMLSWWFGESEGAAHAGPDGPPVLEASTQHYGRDAAWGSGTGVIVLAHTSTGEILAGSGLGAKGVRAEDVGRTAGQMLIDNVAAGGALDEHLADQVIVFMALADGESQIRTGPLSLHTQTAIKIVGTLTGAEFTVTAQDDGTFVIACQGIGFRNPAADPTAGPSS